MDRPQLDTQFQSSFPVRPDGGRPDRVEIAKNWLPRYTGMPLEEFGDYVLLTNFRSYLQQFATQFNCHIRGLESPMQAATNQDGLTMINFGIGSANVATIMDLLIARMPKGVLFLGKCGGLKRSSEIGRFILPIAAIRGEGTSNDYFRLKCQRFLHSSCISSFLSAFKITAWTIEPEWSTRPIAGYGNTTNGSCDI